METNKYLIKALENFGNTVVDLARGNLRRDKHIASGALFDSLSYKVVETPNGTYIEFFAEKYGEFIDKGVSGIKRKYNTPYSYTTKMPPPNKLDKWVVRKGIAPRDKDGKFLPRKTVNFLISRSIFINGIKPSLFFTNAFNTGYTKIPERLEAALDQQLGVVLDNKLKTIIK